MAEKAGEKRQGCAIFTPGSEERVDAGVILR